MDAGLTIKPVGGAPASRARPGRAAVATDLAPARAVTATGSAADAARHDLARNLPAPPRTASEIQIDPQTREVLYRAMVARSGRAVRHAPGDAAMKLQAYRDCASEQDAAEGPLVEKTA